jgi:subtilisin family serine protease
VEKEHFMRSKIIYFCIAAVYFAFISNCVAASDLPYKEGELVVRFAPKTNGKQRTTDERNQILSSFNGGTVKHSIKIVPGLSLVKLPENLTVTDALSKLRGKSGILYVEPNYKIKLLSTFPNDPNGPKPSPDGGEQWGLHNIGQTGGRAVADADIDAPEAWDIATDSNIIVAVIDTGVDYTHPDLAANMWHNPGEIPGNGIDDDHNGYIDDIYGYDFACKYGLNAV